MKYLSIKIQRKDNTTHQTKLKTSEANLIYKLLQVYKGSKIQVETVICNRAEYVSLFGERKKIVKK